VAPPRRLELAFLLAQRRALVRSLQSGSIQRGLEGVSASVALLYAGEGTRERLRLVGRRPIECIVLLNGGTREGRRLLAGRRLERRAKLRLVLRRETLGGSGGGGGGGLQLSGVPVRVVAV
jgi:hypothetical protein